MKLATLNVRGLRDRVKRTAVFLSLKSLSFDVCFLQEVHLKNGEDVVAFTRDWDKGGSRWSVGGVHSSGVGILFGNREMSVEECNVIVPGRALCVDVCFGNDNFRFISVYAPAVGSLRADFFKELYPLCATNKTLVIGGDFNVDLSSREDAGETAARALDAF